MSISGIFDFRKAFDLYLLDVLGIIYKKQTDRERMGNIETEKVREKER